MRWRERKEDRKKELLELLPKEGKKNLTRQALWNPSLIC
jgi:hypothetical protein